MLEDVSAICLAEPLIPKVFWKEGKTMMAPAIPESYPNSLESNNGGENWSPTRPEKVSSTTHKAPKLTTRDKQIIRLFLTVS